MASRSASRPVLAVGVRFTTACHHGIILPADTHGCSVEILDFIAYRGP